MTNLTRGPQIIVIRLQLSADKDDGFGGWWIPRALTPTSSITNARITRSNPAPAMAPVRIDLTLANLPLKAELVARIQAIVRRSKGHAELVIRTGKLLLNMDARSVEADGRRLHVTGKEYSILELLSGCARAPP